MRYILAYGKNGWFKIAFITGLLLSGNPLHAAITLPRLVSDGMILQRDKIIPVWGWGTPGEKVTVSFHNNTVSTVTGDDKKWQVALPAMPAGGPYEMQIQGSNRVIIKNMLLGDVWICSGQSNMEFEMAKVTEKYAAIIASSTNDQIRQFWVNRKYSLQSPLADVESEGWKPADSRNILQFSAVAYFFARSLYEKYKVPIGLIVASVGGTPAEAWTSEDALKQFPAYSKIADQLKEEAYVKDLVHRNKIAADAWNQKIRDNDGGLLPNGQHWGNSEIPDAAGWKTMKVPSFWENEGLKDVDGVVWFRKEIMIPPSSANETATLYLGNIATADSTWVNGIKVGATSNRHLARKYIVGPGLLKPGKNVIVIRIINTNSYGGFVKDKRYQLQLKDTVIDLTGAWQYELGTAVEPKPESVNFFYQPSVLYKGMIAPLVPYGIKGFIWYQGEANTNRAAEYQQLFPAMIRDWRNHWRNEDIPFLYVQLANYLATDRQPAESSWAELREAQTMTLDLSHTGMAITHDLGEWNDIHPQNKEEVGKRLALVATKVAYDDLTVIYSGPVVQSVKKENSRMIITFSQVGSGLEARGDHTLHHFALAGADNKFEWANATIKNNTVVVWSDRIKDPVSVRYAWANNPEGANLYNKEGLPAASFRYEVDPMPALLPNQGKHR